MGCVGARSTRAMSCTHNTTAATRTELICRMVAEGKVHPTARDAVTLLAHQEELFSVFQTCRQRTDHTQAAARCNIVHAQ
jgi:hypothetical protein